MDKQSQRQTEFDLLKVCAFLCVVCLHVAAKPWHTVSLSSWQWVASNFFRGSWAVPVFVMISGRFLLNPEKDMTYSKLMKYLTRVAVAFLFWSTIYEAYQIMVAYPSRGLTEIDWKWEVVEFMTGEYHLWYLPMLCGLYLVTPFLRKITQDRQLMRWYLILFVCSETIACYGVHLPKVGALIAPVFDNLNFNFAMGYTGYYVMGYYLSTASFGLRKERLLYALGLVSLVITPVADIIYGMSSWGGREVFFSQNLSPNVVIMSTSIFVFFCKRVCGMAIGEKTRAWISRLADVGFGAYLVHVVFINIYTDFVGIAHLEQNPLLWIPILSIVFSVLSLSVAVLIRRIPVIGKYIA